MAAGSTVIMAGIGNKESGTFTISSVATRSARVSRPRRSVDRRSPPAAPCGSRAVSGRGNLRSLIERVRETRALRGGPRRWLQLGPPLLSRRSGGAMSGNGPGRRESHADPRLDPRQCGDVSRFPQCLDHRAAQRLQRRSAAAWLLSAGRAVRRATSSRRVAAARGS